MSAPRPQQIFARGVPEYFSRIRDGAARRWDQLEGDPELAGPWHQLFRQVQSPRHILSELLQNADDAGATQATVSIDDNRFTFEHDGQDFIEANFASLCRFGYSNKRALHTIGFRGIGFKSTFSLGKRVELYTPTLAVAFEKDRFTEPHWIDGAHVTQGVTRVEVPIATTQLRREVEKNLADWLKSPISLLFFKNVRRLEIGGSAVHWRRSGEGPIERSEWMELEGKTGERLLLVQSVEEAFPQEALEEIRQERMLEADSSGEFPPCRVEIVLGATGRLYVVLPTGVETGLPFACNAPFIQDPARLKIKDPDTSPTNRWLLERAGRLSGDAMLRWLGNKSIDTDYRSLAYHLLPDVDREATSLEGCCGASVELACATLIEDKPVLLTDGGDLLPAKAAVSVPSQLFEIWPPMQAIPLLDERGRPALAQKVAVSDRHKLVRWQLIEEITKADLIERLRSRHLPQPTTWRRLLNLWTYIGPDMLSYGCLSPETLRIVPVQGKEVLYAGSEVARLGEKKLLQSDTDWEFLSAHLLVLNQNWTRFLADERRERPDKVVDGQSAAEMALAVLRRIGLQETSDISAIIERVAADFFRSKQASLAECVQIAQIAAKLGADAGTAFRYATVDKRLHSPTDGVLFDEDGGLESLLPEGKERAKLLHPGYVSKFKSCSREEWQRWITSGRSALHTLPALLVHRKPFYSLSTLQEEAERRGLSEELTSRYRTRSFWMQDWDFSPECWRHWETAAADDPKIWAKLGERLLNQRPTYWSRARSALAQQSATTGTVSALSAQKLLPAWVLKLREKLCMLDTRDQPQLPTDLLRRTPETEYLLDVEPFVHGRLDREDARELLDLLGVRSSPDGPDRLIERLRALARAPRPPAHEVEKWYRRLDQLLDSGSSPEANYLKQLFRSEKLILAHDGTWVTSDGVFLIANEEDVPGAAVIRPSVSDLSIWHRVGVAERPSADLAMQWLASLTSGSELLADDARRVRTLLARYPRRIWEEMGHWLNLLGEWVKVDTLNYALSLQSLFRWSHLYTDVKRKTADFQRLPVEVAQAEPFGLLPPLAGLVVERFTHAPLETGPINRAVWLNAFGEQLRRIQYPDPAETDRVRAEAAAIAAATWVEASSLEVVPYLGGAPAGTARLADVLWQDGTLFASHLTKAKLAKRIPEEIGKTLTPDLRAALTYAFERSPAEIKDYLEENFDLGPEQLETVTAGTAVEVQNSANAVEGADMREAPTDEGQPDDDVIREINPSGVTIATMDAGAQEPNQEPRVALDGANSRVDRPRPPTPAKPPLIDRFATAHGYRPDGPDRFYAPDGSWIARSNGGRFPWEIRARTGEVMRHLYPKEHCLERDPLQIEADTWSLLEQRPNHYSFLLVDPYGEPVEVTGAQLRAMRDKDQLTIHPATYRLVYDGDH